MRLRGTTSVTNTTTLRRQRLRNIAAILSRIHNFWLELAETNFDITCVSNELSFRWTMVAPAHESTFGRLELRRNIVIDGLNLLLARHISTVVARDHYHLLCLSAFGAINFFGWFFLCLLALSGQLMSHALVKIMLFARRIWMKRLIVLSITIFISCCW